MTGRVRRKGAAKLPEPSERLPASAAAVASTDQEIASTDGLKIASNGNGRGH